MNPKELNKLTQDVLSIAVDAGKQILDVYFGNYDVKSKSDNTPLTTADLIANQFIVEKLKRLTASIPILTEESSEIPYGERSKWHRYWLVDPLDGTREFIKRNGEFSINISLISEGKPLLGVVHAPVLGISYFASKLNGAWKVFENKPATQIHVRRLASHKKHFTVTCGRNHTGERLRTFLSNLGDYQTVPMGSALKSCLVAEGAADIYPKLGLTSEWDTAAAQCIVEEAGGFFTDVNMQELRYNTKESLLNPDFFVFGDADLNWASYL